jgi:chromosome segregation ATPase
MMLANENTLKEKHVLEAEISRSRVTIQVLESDRDSYLSKIKDMTAHLDDVLKKYDDVVSESETLKLEVQNLDNRLKNTEARVRVELLESMKEREERYNDLKASLEFQLQQERDYRISLERKIQEMVKVHDGIEEAVDRSEATSSERSLGNVTQQVHILSDALQSNEYSDDELLFQQDAIHQTMTSSPESFALVEQLTQTLKATKVERDALRKQLDESEDRRSSLEKEVVQAIAASEALREMECTVLQLTREVKEKDVEIKALQEDIDDVRKMYKDQLKSLLVDGDRASVSSNLQEGTKRGDESKPFVPSSFPGMRTF